MGLHLSQPGAEIDFKACYCARSERVSLKASSGGFRDNPARVGLPNGMGTVLLFDGGASGGALLCAMDGSLLTGLRTGAAGGAVSVKAMARKMRGCWRCLALAIRRGCRSEPSAR